MVIPFAGIQLPSQYQNVNLRKLSNGANYNAIFRYLQTLWADEVALVPDTAPSSVGEPFVARKVRSYTHIHVMGVCYGVTLNHRGKSWRYAYIEGRVPVRIIFLFHVKQERNNAPPLEHTLAVVQRFKECEDDLNLPWERRYVHQYYLDYKL